MISIECPYCKRIFSVSNVTDEAHLTLEDNKFHKLSTMVCPYCAKNLLLEVDVVLHYHVIQVPNDSRPQTLR